MKTNTARTMRRIHCTALVCAATAAGLAAAVLFAADPTPTTAPASDVPTTAPAVAEAPATQPAATVESLSADYKKQFGLIQDVLFNPGIITDAAKRAEATPKALDRLKNLVADCDGLANLDPDHKDEYGALRLEYTTYLSLFGDSDATRSLATQANSTDPAAALDGKRSLLMVSWLASADDVDHQTKLVDRIEVLAKDNVKSPGLTSQMLEMARMGCSSPDLNKRLQTLVTDVMKNEVADAAKMQLAADQKLASLENKPLIITGKQPDGKDFTTADWKGKVILVDFWATWCGPCKEELPRVKKLYEDYHAKGLEVLGVSNDQSADDLTKFIATDGGMPWPQLFDADAAKAGNWNPITQGYGINGIPTMFLIDKKGIVRTVTARESMEALIPQMLDEK